MSRIFLSHSSRDNAYAVALRDWLLSEGWDDLFLDLDPVRGIAAGERWERALVEAISRCEAVVFLVSRAWLASDQCRRELHFALVRNKRIICALLEDLSLDDLPVELMRSWQVAHLAQGTDHRIFRVALPDGIETHVTLAAAGLAKLKAGLEKAGLNARFFAWPPIEEPDRAPWRGMAALDEKDAGIFFGRDAPMVDALDRLRGIAEGAPPRLLAILGASGAGKSSFLRAGLLRRLARDDRNFLVLPPVRPERAVITGEAEGLLTGLQKGFAAAGLRVSRDELGQAVAGGTLGRRLAALAEAARARLGETAATAPALVLPLDQAEELFNTTGRAEADAFLTLLRDLLTADQPRLILLCTIRSDAYEQLQTARALEGLAQQTFSLPPIPRGQWASVIEGPAARANAAERRFDLDPALTAALLADIETGSGRDALPLLAFTMGRLWHQHGGKGALRLEDYRALGGIGGAVNAAVERAFARADADPAVPADREARLALLREGLIPWLAGIDLETGSPRRLSARLSEIPAASRPLIGHLVDERLLAREQPLAPDAEGRLVPVGEPLVEPVHEALLRQWGALKDWLAEDFALLTTLETVRRATRDWDANARNPAWAAHRGGRLEEALRLYTRPDLAARLTPADHDYLAACREAEAADEEDKRRTRERELAGARRIAETERSRRRWAMAGVGVAAVLLLVAAAAVFYGFRQAASARERAALMSVEAARNLVAEGRTGAGLDLLIQAARDLGVERMTGPMRQVFDLGLTRLEGERRFARPVQGPGFMLGDRYLVQDAETGAMLSLTAADPVLRPVEGLPGRLLELRPTRTALGYVAAVDAGGRVEFWSLGDGSAAPVRLAGQTADSPERPYVQIGSDGMALLSFLEQSCCSEGWHEFFDLIERRQGQLDSVFGFRMLETAAGQSYIDDLLEEDEAAFVAAGFAPRDRSGEYWDWWLHRCLSASSIRTPQELGMTVLELPIVFSGKYSVRHCEFAGGFLLVVTVETTGGSSEYVTRIVRLHAADARPNASGKELSDTSPVTIYEKRATFDGSQATMTALAATETGFILIDLIGRDLVITRGDGRGIVTEASIRMPSETQNIRLLSSDLAAALVRGPSGQASELVLLDVSGYPAAGIFARRRGIPFSAELFDAAGLIPEQPWIDGLPRIRPLSNFRAFRDWALTEFLAFSGDVSAYFEGVKVVSKGPPDSDGMSAVELRAPPPFGGTWMLPYSVTSDHHPPGKVLLSPGGEWSVVEDYATSTVTVRERQGRPVGQFGVRDRPMQVAFLSALGPELVVSDNGLDLYRWQPDANGGAGRRELIYTSDRLIEDLVVSARYGIALLTGVSTDNSGVTRIVDLSDGTVLRTVAYGDGAYGGSWEAPRVTADGRFWLVREDGRYYALTPLTPAEILARAVQVRGAAGGR